MARFVREIVDAKDAIKFMKDVGVGNALFSPEETNNFSFPYEKAVKLAGYLGSNPHPRKILGYTRE